VTRAVSGQAGLAVDTLELEVQPGDRLLLCSDGIHAVLTDKEIAEFLSDHVVTLEQICQAAIDLANARGGLDNSTVVIVEAS
jgi:protein phosphatase